MKGQLNVQTENILPIIKKFLYSDQEIFLRELVSNATDATQKLKTLAKSGEFDQELGDTSVEVKLNKEDKTISIIDKGIGMTEDEVQKYINEIAFSSATDFVEKYKNVDSASIIGHFGLGFYSAFMVSKKVEIKTLSHKEGSEAVHWSCTGDSEFVLEKSDKKERGTEIILHISDDANEYLEEARIKNLLDKYCKFMPVEIKYKDETVNDSEPIWLKTPADLTTQDYSDFYQKLYPYSSKPLFHIHLNVDYPFNLTGILYFPKLNNMMEVQQNKIQLYSNQVYVTDKVNDIVPEFLTLLHGVIDSPDIPLNVSRSYLQSDGNVKKISSYIVKKVADKLHEIYKEQREEYVEKWKDINVFIKFGLLSDEKFKEKMMDAFLLRNTNNEHFTLDEYKEKIRENQTNKDDELVILYSNNPDEQHTYIEAVKKKGYDVIEFDQPIDTHFIQLLERDTEKLKISRVDSDTVSNLIDKDEKVESKLSEAQEKKLREVYEKVLKSESYDIETVALNEQEAPLVLTQDEFGRRMQEMSELQGVSAVGEMPKSIKARINTNHPLSKKILDARNEEKKIMYAQQAFDLSRLAKSMLKGKDLNELARS